MSLAVISAAIIFAIPQKKEVISTIPDKCSLLLGNLIHQIKDDSSCRISCRNYCDTIKKEYLLTKFTEYQEKCNTCECHCI